MNSAADPRRATLSRVLADAVRAAWGGDAARARRLLRLADRMGVPEARTELLLAAESVRTALPPPPASASPDEGQGVPRVAPPRLRLPAGTDLRNLAAPPLPESGGTAMPLACRPRRGAVQPSRPRRWRGVLAAFVLGVGLLGWIRDGKGLPWDRVGSARGLIASGRAAEAWNQLRDMEGAEGLVVRGEAALAMGDTAAAVADLVHAARADGPPGEHAWRAACRLQELAGREQEAAEAFRLAYAAGVPREHWGRIASALQRAGRTEEAGRVLAGVGR